MTFGKVVEGTEMDWDHIRRTKIAPDRPSEWPEGVQAISMNGLCLFGIHKDTGALYWDGHEVVTRRIFQLGSFERVLAGLAALGTVGVFVVEAGRSAGWWG